MTAAIQGFRLSTQQRRAWLLRDASSAARVQLVLRVEGAVGEDLLREALTRVAARHDALRTAFRRTPGIVLPVQAVEPRPRIDLRTERAEGEDGLRAVERLELERPIDPEGEPEVRAVWVEGTAGGTLILTLSALRADRRSLDVIAADLATAYAAAASGAPPAADDRPLQYLQYSEWQHRTLQEEGEEGAEFWRERSPEPLAEDLPDRRAAGAAGAPTASLRLELGAEAERSVAELARSLGTAPETVALAAWQATLWRHLWPQSPPIALVLDGRPDERLEGAVGPFAQPVPATVGMAPALSFREAVERCHRSLEDAEEWQDLLPAPDGGDRPADYGFEVVPAAEAVERGGLRWMPVRRWAAVAPFPLALLWHGSDAGAEVELVYDPRRFDAAAVGRYGERWLTLLRAGATSPDTPLRDLPVVGEREREHLVAELARSPRPEAGTPVHEAIAGHARRSPSETAVVAGVRRLTYGELLEHADRLARRLRRLGVGPDVPVAILLERSPELVVAILAVLRAGGCYVPLDVVHPPARLAAMVGDAAPRAVITRSGLAERLTGCDSPLLRIDEAPEDEEGGAHALEPPAVPPGALAYVLYTSGSTGRPKGVMVTHGGLAGYLGWAAEEYGLGPGTVAPVHSPAGFDLTVTALLGPLFAGGTTEVLPESEGVESLAAVLASGAEGGRARRFGTVKLTPAHLELLHHSVGEEPDLAEVRTLVVGGEPLTGRVVAAWRRRLPGVRVVNEYGPTETVVGCTAHDVGEEPPEGPVPIGRPVAGARAYVTDPELRLVPMGLYGELSIGGPGVSRGYLGRPGLTAERFVPDPFEGEPGARLYRTGDLARHGEDGALEFAGRNDAQLKIRGFRVEPGEVEAALARHPAVREAVVTAPEDDQGHRRLIAYVVAAGAEPASVDELRRHLLAALPEPMVPSYFVPIDEVPLTANGKVDAAALPDPISVRPDLELEYLAPRSAGEEVLAELWASALGIERVGVRDNFFVLGGDSMRSVRVTALARERGLQCTVQDLYAHPTVEALAARLGCGPGEGAPLDDEEALAEMLDELDRLDDREVRERLRADGSGNVEAGG